MKQKSYLPFINTYQPKEDHPTELTRLEPGNCFQFTSSFSNSYQLQRAPPNQVKVIGTRGLNKQLPFTHNH